MSGRERLAEVLAAHRVNYHQRNVGGESSAELRYTSCDGCDWLGGWHDEQGWEKHLADALLASDALAQMLAEARAEAVASMVPPGPCWHDSGITWPTGVAPRCELRAGHAGAHECDRGAMGGTAVWTDRVDAEPDAGEREAGT